MIRVAAFALVLAATPAAATCRPVPEAVATIRTMIPSTGRVHAAQASLAPVIAAWLESEGLAGADADGFIEVVGDRGVALIPTRHGQVCDGVAIRLSGEALADLAGLVRRFRDLKNIGPEYAA